LYCSAQPVGPVDIEINGTECTQPEVQTGIVTRIETGLAEHGLRLHFAAVLDAEEAHCDSLIALTNVSQLILQLSIRRGASNHLNHAIENYSCIANVGPYSARSSPVAFD
jgi:hypothetical protein